MNCLVIFLLWFLFGFGNFDVVHSVFQEIEVEVFVMVLFLPYDVLWSF